MLIAQEPLIEIERLAHRSRLLQSDNVQTKDQGVAMGNLRRRLSPQVIAELVARYTAGEYTPALSREYGIYGTGPRKLLLAEGVIFRRQGITPEDADTLFDPMRLG